MTVKAGSLKLTRMGGSVGTFYASWAAPSGAKLVKKYTNSKGETKDSKGNPLTKSCARSDAVKSYTVRWKYLVLLKNGKTGWTDPTESETTARAATFDAPAEALKVWVSVKPNPKQYVSYKKNGTDSKKVKKNGKTVTVKVPKYEKVLKYWFTGAAVTKEEWSDAKLVVPPAVPELSVSGATSVKAVVEANDPYADRYQLAVQVLKSGAWCDLSSPTATSTAETHTFTVASIAAGSAVRSRARTRRSNGKWSDWSAWSDTVVLAPPRPSAAPVLRATAAGLLVSWGACNGAQEYEVAYANTLNQLESSTQMSTASQGATSIVLDAEIGRTYYAKVRAKNPTGESAWSAVGGPLAYGTAPDPPTPWSAFDAVVQGSDALLYWEHNSTDNSVQTSAQISVNSGSGWTTIASLGAPMQYALPTGGYDDGATVQWRVRTRGVSAEWSPWSETRAIRVWVQPTLAIAVPSSVEALPIPVTVDPSAPTQAPVAVDVSITALDEHTVPNPDGTERAVLPGESVWSAHYDSPDDPLSIEVSAGDVSLASGHSYAIGAVCAMDSGLSCSAEAEFSVDFAEVWFTLSCDIEANGLYAAEVIPYALEPDAAEEGSAPYAEGVRLAIYRHETDGTMTALVRNMPNDGTYSLVDPHASFGEASYRAVATVQSTGQVVYADAAEDVLDAEVILIQWGEDEAPLEHSQDGDPLEGSVPRGRYLELPWNIEMTETNEPDVNMVEYIGRKHPVAYYGTQLGQTAEWSCVIEKEDAESLALLRELACLDGDVYVREPLGNGYWAHVAPSWSSSYGSGLVKVTIDVTRTATVDECEVM